MAPRLHLTIGEVLSLLREEFPDVSISKIRFLESQGLVDPERTPSGYRKFYDHDVERLRWILLQQKEHFLPLKVIRDRLDPDPQGVGTAVLAEPEAPAPPEPVAAAEPAAPPEPAESSPEAPEPAPEPAPAEIPEPAPAEIPEPAPPEVPEPAPVVEPGGQRDAYTVAELADHVGCTPELIRELEQFGILKAGATVGGVAYFDPGALDTARVGARFAELGVEPRHLRTWRNAADREAGLFEQLVMPLLRQRNPSARQQAAGRLAELIELGGQLRQGLVAEAVRTIG